MMLSRPTNVIKTMNKWYGEQLSEPVQWWDAGLNPTITPPSWTIEHEDVQAGSPTAGDILLSSATYDILGKLISGRTSMESAASASPSRTLDPMEMLTQMREQLLELVRFTDHIQVQDFDNNPAGELTSESPRHRILIGQIKEYKIQKGVYRSATLLTQGFDIGYQYTHKFRKDN